MKSFCSFALGLGMMLSAHVVSAQNLLLGSRIGLGESRLNSKAYPEQPKGSLNVQLGGSAIYKLNSWLGLSAEALFNYHGTRAFGNDSSGSGVFKVYYPYEDRFNFFQAQVPLMLRISMGSGKLHPYVQGGVSVNFSLLATESRTYSDADKNDQSGYPDRTFTGINTISYQYIGAAGLMIDTPAERHYFIELRYQTSSSSAGMLQGKEMRFGSLNLGAGYYF